jgi:tRNA A37 threonylcarbamoyladenosine biosynthesis protein TsaE
MSNAICHLDTYRLEPDEWHAGKQKLERLIELAALNDEA